MRSPAYLPWRTWKTGKEREVPLCDEVMAIICQKHQEASFRHPVDGYWPEQTRRQHENFSKDHVFATRANTPMKNNLLNRFYTVCKKADIADAVPGAAVDIHGMRVSFATLALESGGTPKAVQEILGHSTLDMTMKVYNRARSESKRTAVGALPFATVTTPEKRDVISIEEARKGTA
ncbi:site-specific integrase [Bremerella cremea]|uniref:Site-specific integrase n=1 Tax=Bremerella cremea TaxID=1031537 RepID=A0A368KXW8_9BACT|nr:site-specific integrase [Bremerella cremea]